MLVRSTRRRRPTGISGARSSPGRPRIASTRSGAPSAPEALSGPVAVCIDRPVLSLDRPFTYTLPAELNAGVGSYVRVRFHGKLTRAWILGRADELPGRMLPVMRLVSPVRFFDEPMLRLARWISERYVSPLATVLGVLSPPRVASEENDLEETSNGLEDRPEDPEAEPAFPATLSGYRGGAELLEAIGRASGAFIVRPAPEDEQAAAVHAVGACLAHGRCAIVVVPEAAPVPATATALRAAFGDRVCLYLGGDKRQRYRDWLAVRGGRYDVVVGTRPSVLAPLRNVGLVYVSRESHAAHREDRAPYHHVRDVALRRTRLSAGTCVLS
ncbi:MAG: primosomal protein N', partial [Actinomycetota bacterium]|nr:primosomal protein N' [Actinomycetota bacterium]